ncbi:hypothetical protein EVAR_63900_1 [Eumeta japonica]|uniref:Uncharacterized protein n=1 Tax=Eumeta variegata TaxID=151549 RepID=A0A4C1ZM91_EUMVA|nr:hypothetical protein EVAR_63900_1 [Eumeta japonica]
MRKWRHVLVERPRPPAPAAIQLWVSIVELRTPAHGRLQLTCIATIPDQVGPGENFADVKKQTVAVAVNERSARKSSQDAIRDAALLLRPTSLPFVVTAAALRLLHHCTLD